MQRRGRVLRAVVRNRYTPLGGGLSCTWQSRRGSCYCKHRPRRTADPVFMGIVCMAMIANLQYGWTLSSTRSPTSYHWTRAAIQVAFTIFVLTETWLVPIEGYLVDKFGPRPMVLIGGLCCGIGWVLNSFADSLTIALRRRRHQRHRRRRRLRHVRRQRAQVVPRSPGSRRRALPPRASAPARRSPSCRSPQSSRHGYEAAFLYFGIGQGLVVMLLALRSPILAMWSARSSAGGAPPIEAPAAERARLLAF